MRGLILVWIVTFTLLGAWAPVCAQPPLPPPVPGNVEPQKAPEPKKLEREGAAVAVSYTLAVIGTIIVMVLVCMPARRE